MNRKFSNLLIVLIAFTTLIMLSGCEDNSREDRLEAALQSGVDVQTIGNGNTTFRFEVLDLEDNVSVWYVSTNETTVGAALLDVGLIAGEDGAFGLFVSEVNGITADFAADSTWWAFSIDGEPAMMGVDAAEIEQGKTYAFVLTRG